MRVRAEEKEVRSTREIKEDRNDTGCTRRSWSRAHCKVRITAVSKYRHTLYTGAERYARCVNPTNA